MSRCLEHVEETDDVALEIGAGLFETERDTRRCSEVDYVREVKVFEAATDGVFLIDVAFDECEAFAIRKKRARLKRHHI